MNIIGTDSYAFCIPWALLIPRRCGPYTRLGGRTNSTPIRTGSHPPTGLCLSVEVCSPHSFCKFTFQSRWENPLSRSFLVRFTHAWWHLLHAWIALATCRTSCLYIYSLFHPIWHLVHFKFELDYFILFL